MCSLLLGVCCVLANILHVHLTAIPFHFPASKATIYLLAWPSSQPLQITMFPKQGLEFPKTSACGVVTDSVDETRANKQETFIFQIIPSI